MRVLILGHRARRGGVPTHLVHLARALPPQGIEPVFAVPERADYREALAATGARLVAFDPGGKLDLLAALRVATLVRETGASLVATHTRPVDLWGGLGARLAGVPAVATLHAEPARAPDGSSRTSPRARAHGHVLRALHARTIVVARPFVALAASRLGVPRARLAWVENGVDTDALAPTPEARARARVRLGVAGDAVAVGCIARFVDGGSEEKGQPDLVRALAAAPLPCPVHFVGAGPSLESVRALAARLGVPARFHGEIPSEEIVRGLDVLVLASRSEGCPYVVLEALAAGVPVVSTAVGGVPDLLGETGALVPPGSLAGLGEAVKRLAVDPSARADLAARGLARTRARSSLERFGRETAAIYRAAL